MRINGPAYSHNRHKKAFSAQVLDVIRISDIVLETIDARFIKESRIPEIEQLIKEQGKMLIHVVTKIDLVNLADIKASEAVQNLSHPAFVSTTKKIGMKDLRERIHILAKKTKGHAQVHVGIVGYPNTGKSSIISLLARRAAAPVSSHSGFTKHIRKIRFAKGIQLLDAPGVVKGKENLFEGNFDLKKHALMGVHAPETVRNPELIVVELMRRYPGKLEKLYDVDAKGDPEILLEKLGARWNMLKKKGIFDSDRIARRILKDWHSGKY